MHVYIYTLSHYLTRTCIHTNHTHAHAHTHTHTHTQSTEGSPDNKGGTCRLEPCTDDIK